MVDDCPICQHGGPLDVVAELPSTWLTCPPRAPLPGYLCIVAKRHVEEPFELPAPEMAAFWSEAMTVARAQSEIVRPRKMNYEIHGNSIPHLHLHLFPRFDGDPFEGGPIDGSATGFERSPSQIDALRLGLMTAGVLQRD